MRQRRLEHLQTFLLASRIGSISEAAKLLGIAQPTASAHVRALEDELGFALLERTPSGVRATPRAQSLAREIAPHLDALEDAAHAFLAPASQAPLHVGGAAEFVSEIIAPHLTDLVEAAGAEVRFRFGLADDLLQELRAGALDLVLSAVPARIHGVHAVPWYDEEFVLVAAPAWAARLGGIARADGPAGATAGPAADADSTAIANALASVPVITYGSELPIIRRYWRSVFARSPSDLAVRAVVPDLRGVRAAVVAGAGMSVLPRYLVDADIAAGRLTVLHEPEVAPLNTLYLATRDGDAARRPALRALVDAVRTVIPR